MPLLLQSSQHQWLVPPHWQGPIEGSGNSRRSRSCWDPLPPIVLVHYLPAGVDKSHKVPLVNPTRMRLKDEDYPFYGMSLKDFTKVLQLEGGKATEIRGIHNAWELKKDNELYNEYEGDPDGLARMLEKRWTSTNWTDHQNLKLLNKAKECIKSSTRELEVYIN